MFRIDALIREIETLSGGKLPSTPLCGAETMTVRTFAPLNHAAPDTVAFLAQSKYRDQAQASQAGVLVISQADSEAMYGEAGPARPVVITKNPYAWFAYALQIMTRRPLPAGGVREGAHVDPTAKIAATAVIEAGATVAAGAVIGIPVSVLYRARLTGMLWALFGVLAALLALYVVLLCVGGKAKRFGRETASVTALAALCTVCFTLLDDVLTPLWYGYTWDAAVAYFYTGFFSMLPQTLCTVVSVLLLFEPLKRIFWSASALGKGDRRKKIARSRAQTPRKSEDDGENAASNDGRTQKDVV